MGDVEGLNATQRWMQAVLLDRGHVDGTIAGQVVEGAHGLSAAARLGVYRRSYVHRLHDVMASQFPALRFALGPELFGGFADEYLRACPSTSYTLNDLGAGFGAHLEATRPDRDATEREWWPDFLIELAGFEFAIATALDRPGDRDSRPARAEMSHEAMVLAPLAIGFSHRFPIGSYYRAFGAGAEPDLPLPDPSWCALVRVGHRLTLVDLDETGWALFEGLRGQVSVAAALARDPGLERAWDQRGREWIADGVVVAA